MLSYVRHVSLCIVLCCTGCICEFEHSIADKEHCDTDARLIGSWIADGTEQKIVARDEKTYQLVDSDGAGVRFRVLKIGDLTVATLNAQALPGKKGTDSGFDDEKPVVVVRYSIEKDGSLQFYECDPAALAAAIESGKLHGEISYRRGRVKKIEISSQGSELRGWFEKKGANAFMQEPVLEFKRS